MAKIKVNILYKKNMASTPLLADLILPSSWSVMQGQGGVSVSGDDIKDDTITADNIEGATITAAEIANATITGSQIANATITSTQIANATITSGNIASGTIVGGNIDSGTITGGNITSQTIQAGNIQNLTITSAQIANLTITGGATGNIATNTIAENNIVANTITATSIAANTITANQIASNTITANEITVSSLSSLSANIGTVTAGAITGVTITGGTVRTNASSYPHAVMDSGGITINGQYLMFRLSAGTNIGEIYGCSTDGLMISSFSGRNTYVNGSNNLSLNAGGSYIYLKQGNTNKIRISSSTINCYVALSSSSSCNFAGMTCNGNLSPNASNTRHCGTSGAYWARVYSDAYFTKNATFQMFDKYDDLQILRDLKFDKKGRLIINRLPKEIQEEGFINFGGMTSFNLCSSKKIVECVDDLKKKLNKIESLLGV